MRAGPADESGQLLNFNLQNVLLGLALGAATGLVRTHSPLARISAFLIGFGLGMAFYVLRLAVLPATWLGNAVAVVIVLMLMTTVSALTRDRLPLWAMFIGNADEELGGTGAEVFQGRVDSQAAAADMFQ